MTRVVSTETPANYAALKSIARGIPLAEAECAHCHTNIKHQDQYRMFQPSHLYVPPSRMLMPVYRLLQMHPRYLFHVFPML